MGMNTLYHSEVKLECVCYSHPKKKLFKIILCVLFCLCLGCVDLEHVQVKDYQVWVPELTLFKSDKSVLESSEWLNDNIIFVAMKLLEKQTKKKHIHGWQSTQNGKNLEFQVLYPEAKFIQIFHLGNHWITASNVMCGDHKTVRIYDSLHYSKRPSLDLMKQVCSLVHPKSDSYRFDIMNVQSQKNGSDCGVFAIAYATELAYGRDPIHCQWKAGVLRRHLMTCLEDQTITQFPLEKERRTTMSNRIRKSHEEDIHCTCRMPYDKQRDMICCENCNRWYHKDCEGLDPDGDYTSVKWKCSVCVKFIEDHI